MASNNINKIVQSNINLKPWMLSKSTNQIVNSYIQKIYKQVPSGFRRDAKKVKVASPRAENRGPLSTFKNQEKLMPTVTISPRPALEKKPSEGIKQNNLLFNTLKASNKNNQQMTTKLGGAYLTPSKRNLKTPNYKIYKSLRYGSSSSSSRSSLFKRFDERRRQRQSTPGQINYLIRSFHTSQLEPTYARYLMPARNQQVEANLGSIPDALKFSASILEDLMDVDKATKNKISISANRKSAAKIPDRQSLESWHHPPSLSKYKIRIPQDSAIKTATSHLERSMRRARLSPEQRDYARINVGRSSQLKHPRPPNELFTAQHDRKDTELHEKHRRNRMKKLGLIENTTNSEMDESVDVPLANVKPPEFSNEAPHQNQNESVQPKSATKYVAKSMPSSSHQTESKTVPKLLHKATTNLTKEKKTTTNVATDKKDTSTTATAAAAAVAVSKTNTVKAAASSTDQNLTCDINSPISSKGLITSTPSNNIGGLPSSYTTTSPIAAARALLPQTKNLRTYRYNRSDFFGTKKY